MEMNNENMVNEKEVTVDSSNSVKSHESVDIDNVSVSGRDATLDIASLIKASKEETVKEKSALQKMKEAKESGALGLVVENSELAEGSAEKKLIKNKSESDALKEMDDYIQEQDELIAAAQKVIVAKPPTNQLEMVSMMDNLDTMSKTGSLGPSENGEKEFLRMKTDEDVENQILEIPENVEPKEEISEEKRTIVNILIDKTGLGGDFNFTDEEKEKIFASTEIRLKEVEEIDLSTIKVRKSEKSFIESVEEFQISSSKVPVIFPASRFRAYMTGLSYGEMGDISLNNENVTFDQIHKKLTVIYNKMINPSIGKFESFEDFLRKFAYVDIDLAVYGLVVATFPEVDDIPLTCNNPSCGKSFNHKFSPRTLLRFEKSGNKFLQAMKDVVECPASKFNELVEESPTRTHKRIRLPHSGFIIEIGIASSYDYLYSIVDNMIGEKFEKEHPDDVNGILQLNTALLGLIRAVYVPDGSEYIMYDEFEDMIQALYMIKPDEIAILSAILQKFTDSYSVNFELFDITCPHCGTKTKNIPLDINYLVFLKYQRLMSTVIDIDNIVTL